MILPFLMLVVGLVVLIKGSDYFIEGAAFLARYFGVAELVIGLTIVSMGTSLPELGVSAYASYRGNSLIAVGNVVGSNVANIALILGLMLLFRSIVVEESMYRRDSYFMFGISVIFAAMVFHDNVISRLEGVFLMILFVLYLTLLFKRNIGMVEEYPILKTDGLLKESLKLVIGALGVFIGSRVLVSSAVEIASIWGVSEGAIGSTLVAVGTSLPELAVSATALTKGYTPISLGNVIGSNIFNILWIIGVASLISPLNADDVLIRFNVPIMLAVAVLLILFMRYVKEFGKAEGITFIGIYILFLVANFWR
jgi:cation:H+ antiporter